MGWYDSAGHVKYLVNIFVDLVIATALEKISMKDGSILEVRSHPLRRFTSGNLSALARQ